MKLESMDGIIITFSVTVFFLFLAGAMYIFQLDSSSPHSLIPQVYADSPDVTISPWMPDPSKFNQPPAICLYGTEHDNIIGEQAIREWQ